MIDNLISAAVLFGLVWSCLVHSHGHLEEFALGKTEPKFEVHRSVLRIVQDAEKSERALFLELFEVRSEFLLLRRALALEG